MSSLRFGAAKAAAYNSEATANVGIGTGWRLNAMRRLTELGSGDVVFTAGDGSVHTFAKISTVGTVTTYTRPSSVYATLVKDTSHTLEWTLIYRDQSIDSFDQSSSDGLLAKQADRFGNAVTFTYTASTNRLYQATDPNGRVIDFGWNTGASPAQLTSITDWAYVSGGLVQSSATGSRRQYRLFYDGSGRLIGWSNPINTSGSCPTGGSNLACLTYGSNGLVATIAKTQTYTTIGGSPAALGTATRTATTTVTYAGGEVSQIQDPEQTTAVAPGTTFTRTAAEKMQVVRQGTPASTTTYQFVAVTVGFGGTSQSSGNNCPVVSTSRLTCCQSIRTGVLSAFTSSWFRSMAHVVRSLAASTLSMSLTERGLLRGSLSLRDSIARAQSRKAPVSPTSLKSDSGKVAGPGTTLIAASWSADHPFASASRLAEWAAMFCLVSCSRCVHIARSAARRSEERSWRTEKVATTRDPTTAPTIEAMTAMVTSGSTSYPV